MSSWGDRKTIEELRKEVKRLREALLEIDEYVHDDSRMGNFTAWVSHRARKALDTRPRAVLSSETS